ncbi:MAG TPA: hypothetical protein VJV22_08830 [Acidobacteriaceae bacterium]|nr:hypothetical protein [Acidobacteriaceae bacterium]
MLDFAVDTSYGFSEPPAANAALAAALLESLAAIAVECDLMRNMAQQYSLTKHVRAIEDRLRDMMGEIAGSCAAA